MSPELSDKIMVAQRAAEKARKQASSEDEHGGGAISVADIAAQLTEHLSLAATAEAEAEAEAPRK